MSETLKQKFVKDIADGDKFADFFMVKSKNKGTTKAGKSYLDLELQDNTGIVGAKMWDDVERVDGLFDRGDIIKIRALAQNYRGELQIKIDDIRAPMPGKENLSPEDFLPSTPKNVEEMHAKILAFIESVQNEFLRALLAAFWEDDEFRRGFVRSSAARNIHHAYLGGLLEHTLNVTTLAESTAALYPEINRDLLITMAILHDIGKIRELENKTEIAYSREGMLIGHISIGLEMITEKLKTIMGFPEELAIRCKHVLLSHHGELEFGSPIVPKTPEAIILHYCDNLDAKANLFITAIQKDHNENEEFTTFIKTMGRNVYKGGPEYSKD